MTTHHPKFTVHITLQLVALTTGKLALVYASCVTPVYLCEFKWARLSYILVECHACQHINPMKRLSRMYWCCSLE